MQIPSDAEKKILGLCRCESWEIMQHYEIILHFLQIEVQQLLSMSAFGEANFQSRGIESITVTHTERKLIQQ